MKKMTSWMLGAALLLGGAVLFQAQNAEANKSASAPSLGVAPDFSLSPIDGGKPVNLSNFSGKVRIVDFWATWCPPCRAEIPDFVSLQKQYKSKGLEIIGVSVDQGGPEVVKKFATENGINYTMLMADEKTMTAYGGIRGIPTTFVLDRKGNIIKKYVGQASREQFEKDIKALL